MAEPADEKTENDGGKKQPSLVLFIIIGLVLTLVAAGGGGVLGLMLSGMIQAPEPAKQEASKTGEGPPSEEGHKAEDSHEKPKAEKSKDGGHGTAEGGGHGSAEGGGHGSSEEAASAESEEEAEPDHLTLKPMEPILANLSSPDNVWIRIEGSLVVNEEGVEDIDLMLNKINEGMLGFLKTVSLAQIQGASGYLHLREDLADLAKLQSDGHVQDFIIRSLVVE